MSNSSKLLALPQELLLEISRFLSTRSLAAFSRTCRLAHQITDPVLYSPSDLTELQRILHASYHNQEEGTMRMALPAVLRVKDEHGIGYAALMCACGAGFSQTARKLLEAGISPNPSPESIAALSTNTYTELWRDWGSPLVAAMMHSREDIIRMLLECGLDLGLYTFDDTTHLLTAGRPGNQTTAQLLVDHGLNPRITAPGTTTNVLHLVCSWDNCTPDDIDFLLDNGIDVNQVDGNGDTPLAIAIAACAYNPNGLDVVACLLGRGARVKGPCNHAGLHPLHLAASLVQHETVHLLLEFGAAVNARRPDGRTALAALYYIDRQAQPSGDDAVFLTARTLIRGGASLGVCIDESIGLLVDAIDSHHREGVRCLLAGLARHVRLLDTDLCWDAAVVVGDVAWLHRAIERGSVAVNDDVVECYGNETTVSTRLIKAVKTRNARSIKAIAACATNFNQTDSSGATALQHALYDGPDEVIRYLLPRTFNIIFTTKLHMGPLAIAAANQSTTVVKLLLRRMHKVVVHRTFSAEVKQSLPRKASLHRRLQALILPAIEAAFAEVILRGDASIALVLLQYMEKHQLQLDDHSAILHHAISQKREEIALLLIQHHQAVHNLSHRRYTPLMETSEDGLLSIVDALLNQHVDLTVSSLHGTTAPILADRNNHSAVVRRLLSAASPSDLDVFGTKHEILLLAARHGAVNAAKTLLPVPIPDEEATSTHILRAFHSAAQNGHIPILSLFLAAGLPIINAPDDDNDTALIHALPHRDTVSFLLGHGAAINHRGDYGQTALINAVLDPGIPDADRPALVRLLLAHGADPDLADDLGWTALGHAVQEGLVRVARVLVAAGCQRVTADRFGRTPLHYAGEGEGEEKMVRVLYSGADETGDVRWEGEDVDLVKQRRGDRYNGRGKKSGRGQGEVEDGEWVWGWGCRRGSLGSISSLEL
ncbi:ankyrin repeat-containing domain protein [Aspergillus egyptiacus]|nr:ankyrin repeat-containing domain protein [Aspergillus egyptiacus]